MDRVITMLKTKYATFTGRARRKEYWYFVLFYLIAMAAAAVVDAILFSTMENGPLQALVTLGLLCPSIAVGFRRFHDIDRSAWWLLIGLIPILGTIVVIYWAAQPGTKGDNRFGPDPIANEDVADGAIVI